MSWLFSDKTKCFSLQTNDQYFWLLYYTMVTKVEWIEVMNSLNSINQLTFIWLCLLIYLFIYSFIYLQEQPGYFLPVVEVRGPRTRCLNVCRGAVDDQLLQFHMASGFWSFCKNTTHTGCGSTLRTPLERNCFFKVSISKYSYILQ